MYEYIRIIYYHKQYYMYIASYTVPLWTYI